jgi:hypothetical protein
MDMSIQSEVRINQFTAVTKQLLQRPADYAVIGQEVIARDGNLIAAAPGPSLSSGSRTSSKRKYTGCMDDDRKALQAMTLPDLKKLIKEGNYKLSGGGQRNKRKPEIVDGIVGITSYSNR